MSKIRPEFIETTYGPLGSDNDHLSTTGYVNSKIALDISDAALFEKVYDNLITKTLGDNILTNGDIGGAFANFDDGNLSDYSFYQNNRDVGNGSIAIDYTPAFVNSRSSGKAMWQSFTPASDFFISAIGFETNLSGGSGTLEIKKGPGYIVTSVIRVGDTATLTTSVPHAFSVGELIELMGAATPTYDAYNDVFEITGTGTSTISFTILGEPPTPALGSMTVVGSEQIIDPFAFSVSITGLNIFRTPNRALLNGSEIYTWIERPSGGGPQIRQAPGYAGGRNDWTTDSDFIFQIYEDPGNIVKIDKESSKFTIKANGIGTNIAAIELITAGAGSTDWTLRNKFGVLNISKSLDDGSSWADVITLSSLPGEATIRNFTTSDNLNIGAGANLYFQTYSGSWVNRMLIAENGAISVLTGGSFKLPNGTSINEISTDGTLAGNSDDTVPTEKAIKTYIDTQNPPTTLNAATYTVLITDKIINVTYTSTGAVTALTIPASVAVDGNVLHIKDAARNSGANSITIATSGGASIEGSANFVINNNGDSASFYYDATNTNWNKF